MFRSLRRFYNKSKKLLFIILLNGILLVGVGVFTGYGDSSKIEQIVNPFWQEGDWWIMKIWQRAIEQPVSIPPWVKSNILKFEVKKGKKEMENNIWTLQISDVDKREIGVEIDQIEVYYDQELTLIGAKAFGHQRKTPVPLEKLSTYTYFRENFFLIPNEPQKWIMKEYKVGLMETKKNTYKIDINPAKDEYQLWQKDKPWWIYYQSKSSPIKCQVIEWSSE